MKKNPVKKNRGKGKVYNLAWVALLVIKLVEFIIDAFQTVNA